MKILAIGDPHAKRGNAHTIKLLAQKIQELCDSELPDIIVVLGDLANYFEKMHLDQWNSILYFMESIGRSASEVYYIVGNHDMKNNQQFFTTDHFFNSFKNSKLNITVVDQLHISGRIAFLPYVPTGRFDEAAASMDLSTTDIIFCHQEFFGAKMGAITSKTGDKWGLDLPQIVSGHIHDRDWLQTNILYVGAPYQTSFGDSSQKSVEIIEIIDKKITTKAVDLQMPKKITKKLTSKSFSAFKLPDTTNEYRLNITGTAEELHKLKKTKHFKELSGVCKISLQALESDVVKKNLDKKGFEDILKDSLVKEPKTVQSEFEETWKDAYQD